MFLSSRTLFHGCKVADTHPGNMSIFKTEGMGMGMSSVSISFINKVILKRLHQVPPLMSSWSKLVVCFEAGGWDHRLGVYLETH